MTPDLAAVEVAQDLSDDALAVTEGEGVGVGRRLVRHARRMKPAQHHLGPA